MAAAAPLVLRAHGRARVAAVAGLTAYVSGHGIHLAANSIATQAGGETAYLWDELVGHAIWYGGMYLLVGALLVVTRPQAPRPGPLRLVLALGLGVTWCTNAIGGHSVPLAVVATTALLATAARDRRGTAVDVLVAGATALLCLFLYWALGLEVEHT